MSDPDSRRSALRPTHAAPPDRDGFSLVEILVVIVVLGLLATIAVFAVRGVTDRGEQSVVETDRNVLETAEESYRAMNGRYASEEELVASGVLRSHSRLHDITMAPDGTYTIVLVASPTATTTP